MNLLILSILKLHILIKPFFKAKKIKKIILILRFIESKRLAESHYNKMARWFGVGKFTTECYCKRNRSEQSL